MTQGFESFLSTTQYTYNTLWTIFQAILVKIMNNLWIEDLLYTELKYQEKILINNNLKVIRLHDLRHTSATILLNNGNLDIKRIQNWLGHSSYNTTANIYTHLDKSANVVTGDVVSNLLKL